MLKPSSKVLRYIAGVYIVHDDRTGAMESPRWTGVCRDAECPEKFWYVGYEAGAQTFKLVDAESTKEAHSQALAIWTREIANEIENTRMPRASALTQASSVTPQMCGVKSLQHFHLA